MAKRDPEWVVVAETGNDEEAFLISGFLTSRGIENQTEGPSTAFPLPENLGALGLSRVVTPPDRAAEAKKLLAERDRRFKPTSEPDSE